MCSQSTWQHQYNPEVIKMFGSHLNISPIPTILLNIEHQVEFNIFTKK